MGAMAITRTIGDYHDRSGSFIRKIGLLTASSSYATNGETLPAQQFGMGKVDLLLLEPFSNGTVIRLAKYDVTNGKLKFFDMAGDEIANGTDLSAYTARFEAIGK